MERKSRRKITPNVRLEGFVTDQPKRKKPPILKRVAPAAATAPTPPPVPPSAPPSPSSSPTPQTATPPPPLPEDNFDVAADVTPGARLTKDQQIALVKKLYTDQNFSGAFSGIRNLQRSIEREKKIRIPQTIIQQALLSFPHYVTHLPNIT